MAPDTGTLQFLAKTLIFFTENRDEIPILPLMPTYEYECAKCNKTFEIFQSMKDKALTTCPKSHCRMKTWGKGKVKRKLGAGAGFIFKGSGFYITDYRSEGYKSAATKDKPAEAKTESKGDGGKKEAAKPAPAKKEAPKKASSK